MDTFIVWGFKGEGEFEYVKIVAISEELGAVEDAVDDMDSAGYKHIDYAELKDLIADYVELNNEQISSIKHYDNEAFNEANMPDATSEDYYADETKFPSVRLAFVRQVLEEKYSNKTHEIISYRDGDNQLWYRIIER